jgi:hypothetical protein
MGENMAEHALERLETFYQMAFVGGGTPSMASDLPRQDAAATARQKCRG